MSSRTRSIRPTNLVARVGASSLLGALVLVLLTESPAWGVALATKTANATSGAGLLIAMSAGVVILGIAGFIVLTWSKRKRAPQQCASEREALELAERAVRYWEGALAHLQHSANQGQTTSDLATEGRESEASLLEKAKTGHAKAVQARDECQLELIRCMASGPGQSRMGDRSATTLEPLRIDGEHTPPTIPGN